MANTIRWPIVFVAAMPSPDGKHYYWEIMLPGAVLGMIVGYATQKYVGRQPQLVGH